MRDDRAKQERPFLGDALNRLQRMLGVTGSASPEYDDGSKIVPVAIIGDGTFPGYGAGNLRRFKLQATQANNAGNPSHVGFTATKDCIINRITANWLVANVGLSLRYFGPNDALPFAIATPAGVMIDRALSFNEVSPLLSGGDITGAVVGGGVIWFYEPQAAQVGIQAECLLAPFLLMAGASIILRGQTVNNRVNINVEGMAL